MLCVSVTLFMNRHLFESQKSENKAYNKDIKKMSEFINKVTLHIQSKYIFCKVLLFVFDVVVLVDLGIRFPLCDCTNRPGLVSLISECGPDAMMLKPK